MTKPSPIPGLVKVLNGCTVSISDAEDKIENYQRIHNREAYAFDGPYYFDFMKWSQELYDPWEA
jgi:hypothetical protein